MKKLIFLFAVLILSMPCYASNYRGMFDIGGGPVFANERMRTSTGEFKNKQTTFAGMFSTAHGCQFKPWLFAGVGVGVNCEWKNAHKMGADEAPSNGSAKNNLISIPLFVDIRWDLDISRKVTPYADLRLGYQLGMEGYVNCRAQSITNPAYKAAGWMKSGDGMYVQVSAGVRLKIGKSSGLNLGVSYVPLLRREILIGNTTFFSNRDFLLLNVGIDIQGKGKSTIKEDRKQKLYRLQQRKLKQQSKNIDFQ
ncbi:MAG: hypothetical protein K2K75_06345 [Muribaculaceae bacterium]|nr:hypothetical protein [Muribaculaceae bacterium]